MENNYVPSNCPSLCIYIYTHAMQMYIMYDVCVKHSLVVDNGRKCFLT
jgi:hypothetical protein